MGHSPFRHARCIILLFVVLLNACASLQRDPQPLRENLTVHLDQPPHIPHGSVYLKPIPGGLQGKAADKELLRVTPVNDVLHITTGLLVQELAKQARPLAPDSHQPGALVTPRLTRIARVATFFEPLERDDNCSNFSMGLRGERRGGQLLVYVDRAAAIIGTHYRAPYIFEYDLRFPQAGLYLVGLRRSGFTVMPFIVHDTQQLLAWIRPAACDIRIAATG